MKHKFVGFRADEAQARKLADLSIVTGGNISEALRQLVENSSIEEVVLLRPVAKLTSQKNESLAPTLSGQRKAFAQ